MRRAPLDLGEAIGQVEKQIGPKCWQDTRAVECEKIDAGWAWADWLDILVCELTRKERGGGREGEGDGQREGKREEKRGKKRGGRRRGGGWGVFDRLD